MVRACLGSLFLALFSACSDGGSSGAGGQGGAQGGAGGECATGAPVTTRAGERVCSFNEGTELAPHEDFAGCGDRSPNSACSRADFCALQACGTPDSMFDALGCRRTLCVTNDDCNADETCYATPEGVCLEVSEYACGPTEDAACGCVADLICGHESHCIPTP